jgi:hypothetical protein
MFYAHLYTVIKNFQIKNVIITLFCLLIFGFLKSIKQSIIRIKYWSK